MYRVSSAAVGALSLLFALPAAAHAAPPVCPDADFTISPGEVLQFSKPVCNDPEGNPYQVSSVSDPPHGTIGGTPDAGTYTPDNGFHGRDEFTYRVTDSTNETSQPATVRILVDTAPTCADGSVSTLVNQPLRIPFPCDDADGDGLFIEWTDGDHGIVDFDETTGEFVYTPAQNYVGSDSFVYAVRDDFGLTSGVDRTTTIEVKPAPVATVVPTVTPPPPPPPPKDVTAPSVSLSSRAKPLKQALSKGLSIVLTTNENSTAQFTLTVDKATARRFKLDRKAKKPVTVGTLSAALTPGSRTVTIKLSSKAKRAFKSAKTVKLLLTVVVTDTAGNKTTKTLVVTLRR
jgi:hypothetical protein